MNIVSMEINYAGVMEMDASLIAELEACARLSYTVTGAFPQVVARLGVAGVERYHTDLVRAEKTSYLPDGQSHVCAIEPVGVIADRFDAGAVAAAVAESQTGTLPYRDFMARIAAAGCIGYIVSIVGRRALYLGRCGDTHVELFPGQS